jgi:hypothetical protein
MNTKVHFDADPNSLPAAVDLFSALMKCADHNGGSLSSPGWKVGGKVDKRKQFGPKWLQCVSLGKHIFCIWTVLQQNPSNWGQAFCFDELSHHYIYRHKK